MKVTISNLCKRNPIAYYHAMRFSSWDFPLVTTRIRQFYFMETKFDIIQIMHIHITEYSLPFRIDGVLLHKLS